MRKAWKTLLALLLCLALTGGMFPFAYAEPSPPAITGQPKSVTVAVGEKASFTVKASGENLEYQWYYKAPGASSWTAVKYNGTSATYTLTTEARHDGYQYRCRAKNSAGRAFTSPVTLTVLTKPAITTQPRNANVAAGETAGFVIEAKGKNLSYQWYYKAPGSGSWTPVKNNGTSAVYAITTAARHNGYQYRCRVSNAAGSVFSSSVTLTLLSKPAITAPPKSAIIKVGGTASFTVAASGSNLEYQWYYKSPTDTAWKEVSAASGKTATYSFTTEARHNGYQYRCRVKNAAGRVFTEGVTLTVIQDGNKAYISGEGVNFRTGPGTQYKIIDCLKKGTQVMVLGTTSNGWTKVRYNDKEGYIYSKYISYKAPNSDAGTYVLPALFF